jgi:hypothetical protein
VVPCSLTSGIATVVPCVVRSRHQALVADCHVTTTDVVQLTEIQRRRAIALGTPRRSLPTPSSKHFLAQRRQPIHSSVSAIDVRCHSSSFLIVRWNNSPDATTRRSSPRHPSPVMSSPRYSWPCHRTSSCVVVAPRLVKHRHQSVIMSLSIPYSALFVCDPKVEERSNFYMQPPIVYI